MRGYQLYDPRLDLNIGDPYGYGTLEAAVERAHELTNRFTREVVEIYNPDSNRCATVWNDGMVDYYV